MVTLYKVVIKFYNGSDLTAISNTEPKWDKQNCRLINTDWSKRVPRPEMIDYAQAQYVTVEEIYR